MKYREKTPLGFHIALLFHTFRKSPILKNEISHSKKVVETPGFFIEDYEIEDYKIEDYEIEDYRIPKEFFHRR